MGEELDSLGQAKRRAEVLAQRHGGRWVVVEVFGGWAEDGAGRQVTGVDVVSEELARKWAGNPAIDIEIRYVTYGKEAPDA